MLDTALTVSLALLSLAILGGLYRVLRGPSMPDRIIALDTVGIQLLSITAVICVMLRTQAYVPIILLVGIVAFLGTVAFSKYLEKGVVIEHERDH